MMGINTSKENLCINKLVCNKKEIIFVEKDMIVPDTKPDVLNTICTSGVVCLYKTELQDDKLKIDGGINTYIMYLAENSEDKIRGINTNLDFTEIINLSNCKEGMSLKVNTNLKSIECQVLNGRKIGIKATLEIFIEVYSTENIDLVNNIEEDESIQILKEELKVNELVGVGNTKIYAKETVPIQNVDNIAEILKVNSNICDKDIKISYNKILSKAEARIKIMYLTEDNRINSVNAKVPIVGFIDIPNVADGNICNTNYEVKNIIIKPNQPEEHSINVEIEVLVTCMVYQERTITLIQDMYSPYQEIAFNLKQYNAIINAKEFKDKKQIRDKIKIDNIEGKQLIDVDIFPSVSNEGRINNPNKFDGELECDFMFADNNMNIERKHKKIPFDYVMDNLIPNSDLNFSLQIDNSNFVVRDGGEVDCDMDINIECNSLETRGLNIIENVERKESLSDQDYSVIVYIVKSGDTLWNIAKKFKTTVDFIIRTNGIEDENKINIGQKLYIPRFSKIGV